LHGLSADSKRNTTLCPVHIRRVKVDKSRSGPLSAAFRRADRLARPE
jgi:hypothetical protein